MPILYQKWYSIGMSYYDDIYEIAVDKHYLFTTIDAAMLGIPGIELVKLAHRNRLKGLGNGVYRLVRYVPSESDPYALAVARVGKDAFLWGESVIALLGLAPTNPNRIYVATPHRIRRKLPNEIELIRVPDDEKTTFYEGIPCQRAISALYACRHTIMPKRLKQALKRGRAEGYITAQEERWLKEEFGW